MNTSAWLVLFVLSMCSGLAQAAVKGEVVEYKSGGTVMKGYLVYDDALTDKRPGVLVVHEWWGHNEYARNRARMLVEMGYTALAVDMYGDSKQAGHPDEAGKIKAKVLVLNGADDSFVKPEQIAAFKQEMDNAKVDYRFISYPWARHAFTNPQADATGKQFNMPLAYQAEADQQSWAEMSVFIPAAFSVGGEGSVTVAASGR